MFPRSSSSPWLGLFLVIAMLALVPTARGQVKDDLKLHLSHEAGTPPTGGLTENVTGDRRVTPTLGEFRISLDSGVLTPERRFALIADEFQPPPYRMGDTRLVLRGDPWGGPNPDKPRSSLIAGERSAGEPGSVSAAGNPVGPTLTWNAPYLQTEAATGKPPLGARRRIGRWAVYGEFARDSLRQLPVAAQDKTRIPLPPQTMANKSVFAGNPRTPGTRLLDPRVAEERVRAIALDNYYLEAIYSFLPSFQGRVSYNRAIAETRDQKEKIQVEGIVEAGKDVMIKAGYGNESVPELKSNRNANDTKVWTEFILKF